MRDDRPFGGADPPAVLFRYSRDRRGEHPQAHLATWSGILQADAVAGYGELYATDRLCGGFEIRLIKRPGTERISNP